MKEKGLRPLTSWPPSSSPPSITMENSIWFAKGSLTLPTAVEINHDSKNRNNANVRVPSGIGRAGRGTVPQGLGMNGKKQLHGCPAPIPAFGNAIP